MKIFTKISSIAVMLVLCGFQGINAQPTQSAPIPTRPAANVKSIYSDTYTTFRNIEMKMLPGWGQATTAEKVVLFDNDNMFKLSNFNWAPLGINPSADFSDMDSVHMDAYFVDDRSQINLGLQTYTVNGNPEIQKYSTYYISHQMGKWVSYDVAIKEFTAQGQPCKTINVLRVRGGSTVYLDNIYAYKGIKTAVADIRSDDSFKIYPTVVTSALNVESTENIQKVNIFNTTGQSVGEFNINQSKATINLSHINSGTYIVSIQFSSGRVQNKRIVKL